MKHVKHDPSTPSIDGWSVFALENVVDVIEKGMREAVEEVLSYAFENDKTNIYFPVEYGEEPGYEIPGSDGIGGPEVADPLTVYLQVGISGCNDDEKPTYEFNLRDALADSICGCANDGSFSAGLGRLSLALRGLADEIDAARAESNNRSTP